MSEMIFRAPPLPPSPLGRALETLYRADEDRLVANLLAQVDAAGITFAGVTEQAAVWVQAVRDDGRDQRGVALLLREYDLSTDEGVVLMCLAEALLRVPDAATADRLIRDKLVASDWGQHLGHSDSLFVNAATWGLLFSDRLVNAPGGTGPGAILHRLAARLGEPVIRVAIRRVMALLGETFVLGRDLDEA
ncbi:MAG: trifunctional transcriptional regulator/proline dehydrogenase/L-glutamate gamma-semialdehyde dehydrogenase, partial [Porticoccaceae bacterium]